MPENPCAAPVIGRHSGHPEGTHWFNSSRRSDCPPYNGRVLAKVIILSLSAVAVGVALLNVPFGYWRAGTRRFSLPWFLAIHLPVPIVVAMRVLSGHGFNLATIPVLVAAFFTGQFLGARIRMARERCGPPEGGAHDRKWSERR
jgi:hypothetical protein